MVSGCGRGGQLGLMVSHGCGSGSQLGGEFWGGFVDCLILVSIGFGVLDLRCFGVFWVLFSMGFGVWLLRKCKKRNKNINFF